MNLLRKSAVEFTGVRPQGARPKSGEVCQTPRCQTQINRSVSDPKMPDPNQSKWVRPQGARPKSSEVCQTPKSQTPIKDSVLKQIQQHFQNLPTQKEAKYPILKPLIFFIALHLLLPPCEINKPEFV